MSAVVTGVTQKLQDLMPGQIGTNKRWDSTSLERYIMLADRAVAERTGYLESFQVISLEADTAAYDLDSEFIDVFTVEYASDGSTYDRYLRPCTLDDLDKLNLNWRDDSGTRPELYTLIGCPGTPGAQIHIHRPMSSVDSQTIRVRGHRIGTTSTNVPDDVQRKAHVPYVMAMLVAQENPREAASWYGKFLAGCDEVSARFISPYSHGLTRVEFGWR